MKDTYNNLQKHLQKNCYTWLITGVAGFIGSNLLESLLKLNQRVIGIDNFSAGYQRNLDEALECVNGKQRALFEFHEGDITSLKDCQELMSGVDYILHHAALGSVSLSLEDPIQANKDNVDGFLNMLVAARDAKIKRFVYASSSSIYGDHQGLPKVEEKIGNLLSPYALTKHVNEVYAQVFSKCYSIETIGLRYFNIFGKRQDPHGAYTAVIPTWVDSILNGKDVFINGDGKTTRDYCYIDNVVEANLLAATAQKKEAINEIYNIAFGEETSLNELFNLIQQKEVARNSSIVKHDPIYREFRDGDVRHSQADITKAKELLGYQPAYNVSTGLDNAMDWYVQHIS